MNKPYIKYTVVIILAILLFLLGRCTSPNKTKRITTTITVPEKKGAFQSPEVLIPESNDIKSIIKLHDTILIIPQVNEELMQKYIALQNENDINKKENEQFKLYSDAISINTYKNKFDNNDIELIITSKTQGKLLEVIPEYTIKSKQFITQIDIPKQKEKVFTLNTGLYTTYSKELKTFDPGIKLDAVTKGGHIISAGYSLDKNIMVSYSIPIFSIKK